MTRALVALLALWAFVCPVLGALHIANDTDGANQTSAFIHAHVADGPMLLTAGKPVPPQEDINNTDTAVPAQPRYIIYIEHPTNKDCRRMWHVEMELDGLHPPQHVTSL